MGFVLARLKRWGYPGLSIQSCARRTPSPREMFALGVSMYVLGELSTGFSPQSHSTEKIVSLRGGKSLES